MNKVSVKLSDEVRTFSKKLNVNLIKKGKEIDILSYSDTLEIVVKYFKSNNDRYIEMVDQQGDKNV